MLRAICLRWLYNCRLNGEIDFQDRHIAALQNMPLFLDGKETGGYRIFRKPPDPMNTMVIMLNQTHRDPVMREIFNRRDFRVALSLGMDRQEIIDTIHVGQGESYEVVPRPESLLQNEQLAPQFAGHDPAQAGELLDGLGYEREANGVPLEPDGEPISLDIIAIAAQCPDRIEALELLRQQSAEMGIGMTQWFQDRTLI